MATRRTTKTADETAAPASGFDFDNIEIEQSEIQRTKTEKPNPLYRFVEHSYNNENMRLKTPTLPDDDAVKEATNFLRRAAAKLDKATPDAEVGLNIVHEKVNGGTILHFWTKNKKKIRYTAADVRAWAESNGVPADLLSPRIDKTVSTAYRQAHGYEAAE